MINIGNSIKPIYRNSGIKFPKKKRGQNENANGLLRQYFPKSMGIKITMSYGQASFLCLCFHYRTLLITPLEKF